MTRHPPTPLLKKAGNNYDNMKVSESKSELDKRNVNYESSDLKADLIKKLQEADVNADI
ncbi:hypothetical protein K7U28_002143 [Listeria monocytogenes]|nr:hypothetical protein [Listeria monocytogenes]